jgi:hypothetical protein
MDLDELAQKLNVLESVDKNKFQRKARILQSLWREEKGYPMGMYRSRPLGSSLEMPWARDTLANFFTDTIRDVVKAEVLSSRHDKQKLYGKPRIFNNLLSSQPLCFNLFGEPSRDLKLMSSVISALTNGRFTEVTNIEFEYSPGRSDNRYTGDRSAFDVFIRCKTQSKKSAFLGIEVKYHENLQDEARDHRLRYDEIASEMNCFHNSCREKLKKKPLQQIWRDHLLAGITQIVDDYADGMFIVLYPSSNNYCANAVSEYQKCLTNDTVFTSWTLEQIIEMFGKFSNADWINQFYQRYLNFKKIETI